MHAALKRSIFDQLLMFFIHLDVEEAIPVHIVSGSSTLSTCVAAEGETKIANILSLNTLALL